MKDAGDSSNFEFSEVVPLSTNLDRSSVPSFDAGEFREHVDDFDITEEQKDELLRALWSIAVAFVDLGFPVENIPRAVPALAEFSSLEDSRTVQKNIHAQQFSDAASKDTGKDDSR